MAVLFNDDVDGAVYDGQAHNDNNTLLESSLGDLGPFIISGLTVSAGAGLDVTVASGVASIGGQIVKGGSFSILGLTPATTNHLYLLQNGNGSSNTTGTQPANSVKLGTATTDGASVTAVGQGWASGRQTKRRTEDLVQGSGAGHPRAGDLSSWHATNNEGNEFKGTLAAGAMPSSFSGPLTLTADDASQSSTTRVLILRHTYNAGFGANGIGAGMQAEAENTAGGQNVLGRLDFVATNDISANFTSKAEVRVASNNTDTLVLTMAPGVTDLVGALTITRAAPAANPSVPTYLTITGIADTALAAGVEAPDVVLNLARTVQFATGALTNQRAVKLLAPTYAFVGASVLTTAATLYIDKAPAAGANATITNAYSLWVDDGLARFDGTITCPHTGTNSERFGAGATASGTRGTVVGNGAADVGASDGVAVGFGAANNTQGTAVGSGAVAATNATSIGYSSSAQGEAAVLGSRAVASNNSVSIGYIATCQTEAVGIGHLAFGFASSIAIGSSAITTASSQILLGGTLFTSDVDCYLGKGITNASPLGATIQPTGGSGSNIAGPNFTVAGGKATGNATSGDILFSTSDAGSSGTTLQTLREKWRVVNNTGEWRASLFSSTTNREVFSILPSYVVSTDASRTTRAVFATTDFGGEREFLRGESSGTAAMIGFLGAAAVVRPSSTTDLRQALIDLGLYTAGGATPLDLNGGNLTVNAATINADSTLADGVDLALGTTSGTKIGTAANQKIALHGATPVVQDTGWNPTNVTTDRAFDANATTLDEVADVLGTLILKLIDKGIIGA